MCCVDIKKNVNEYLMWEIQKYKDEEFRVRENSKIDFPSFWRDFNRNFQSVREN